MYLRLLEEDWDCRQQSVAESELKLGLPLLDSAQIEKRDPLSLAGIEEWVEGSGFEEYCQESKLRLLGLPSAPVAERCGGVRLSV